METLTKKQLLNGVYFTYRKDSSHLYKIGGKKGSYYLESFLLFKSGDKAIQSNQLSVGSLTDNYLNCWDIHFGKKNNFRVKLSELHLSEVQNFELF